MSFLSRRCHATKLESSTRSSDCRLIRLQAGCACASPHPPWPNISPCHPSLLLLWCAPGPLFHQLPQLRAFLRELRPVIGSAGLTAALAAADELQALGQLLVAWGVPQEQLLLEPLLTPQAEYFSGPLFQVLLQSHTHHGDGVIHTSAVAAGGRYDALLRSLWSPAAAALMPAPGAGVYGHVCDGVGWGLLPVQPTREV